MIEIIIFICAGLVPAIVLHEYAHGWAAYQLGDPTAKVSGRLTINPIKHIDPVGSILVPGLLFLAYKTGVTGGHPLLFGWAKPVPVNFARLHKPKRDMMLVAMAGPAVNIVLAFLIAQWLKMAGASWHDALIGAFEINLVLAVFNMIPIPPLDGSRVVSGLLPNRIAYDYNRLEPWGIFIVLLAVNFGLLDFIYPVISFLAGMMGVAL